MSEFLGLSDNVGRTDNAAGDMAPARAQNTQQKSQPSGDGDSHEFL